MPCASYAASHGSTRSLYRGPNDLSVCGWKPFIGNAAAVPHMGWKTARRVVDISARSTSSEAEAGANGIAYAAASSVSLAGWSLRIHLPPDGKLRPVSSARRLSRIWEKTARRAGWSPLSLHGAIVQARSLRSLHIERACVRPFSASSVDFPRRLCNGGEHSSPRAPPEAPC